MTSKKYNVHIKNLKRIIILTNNQYKKMDQQQQQQQPETTTARQKQQQQKLRNERAQSHIKIGQIVSWEEAEGRFASGVVHELYGKQYVIVVSIKGKHFQQIEAGEIIENGIQSKLS
jgi:uncharacterized protein YijF (DUF1287 family)